MNQSPDGEPSVGQRQTSTGCVSSAAVQLSHHQKGQAYNVSSAHSVQRDSAVMTSDQSEHWRWSGGCVTIINTSLVT